ncbi:MAG: hypothetical protein FK733_13085, partial [Asgard group archaeon]|nr:hypothetical protein [Asgard group archaeon]
MKKKVIVLGLIIVILNISFVSLNYFSTQATQDDGSFISSVNNDQEKGPLELDSKVYDCYANGEIEDRGSSINPYQREASSSGH